MKTFIKYLISIKPLFNFGPPKKNKNGDLYFCVFGLEAHNISMLEPKLQKFITLGNSVPGYGVSYTPPQQSQNGQGMIYFGPKEDIKGEAFDVFLDQPQRKREESFLSFYKELISGGYTVVTTQHVEVHMKYKVINLLSGIVTVVVANNVYSAIKKGQMHFSEPNRKTVPVQVVN